MLDTAPDTRLDTPDPDLRHLGCGSRWAVCQTRPQAERWANANLRRQGYDTYLPMRVARRRDRVVPTLFHTVPVPLFTSYLFVCIQSPLWAPIRHTYGVLRLLMSNGQPAMVPDAAISALQAVEALAATQPPDAPQWAPGAPVAVARGILAGFPGVVLQPDGDYVKVAVLFLGALRNVSLPGEYLRARDDG